MNETQKEMIIKIVNTFSKLAKIEDQNMMDNTIRRLCSMNVDDAIDTILVYLNDMLEKKLITLDDVSHNLAVIINLNPHKYSSLNDLISRLNWLKSMNMEHIEMPLNENHQLVLDAFDEFNSIIEAKFDCYYTGGLMGYLATNHPLERYHADLDLLINEEQLLTLKELIDCTENFEFISNMEGKKAHGHEYQIVYKGTAMSIGLFLFERKPNDSITIKNYYFEEENGRPQLFVDKHNLSKDYTDLSFSNEIRYHNGIPYKMKSLESIYNSKKNSRPKDKHDAEIIKDQIDMLIDYRLDFEESNNFDIKHTPITESVIHIVEEIMKKQKPTDYTNSSGPKMGN